VLLRRLGGRVRARTLPVRRPRSADSTARVSSAQPAASPHRDTSPGVRRWDARIVVCTLLRRAHACATWWRRFAASRRCLAQPRDSSLVPYPEIHTPGLWMRCTHVDIWFGSQLPMTCQLTMGVVGSRLLKLRAHRVSFFLCDIGSLQISAFCPSPPCRLRLTLPRITIRVATAALC
jgi:hypothetical protein